MSAINSSMISAAIKNALKYIPEVWPLQQFIATNPLWDFIDTPIEEVSQNLSATINIESTLSVSEYWHDYQQGKIGSSALMQAIAEFSDKYFQSKTKSSNDTTASVFQQLLYNFVTEHYQKINLQDKIEYKESETNSEKILFSHQVRSYDYDNVIDTIQSECLSWIATYFNPSSMQQKLIDHISHSEQNQYPFYHFWCSLLSQKSIKWESFLKPYSNEKALEYTIGALLNELSVPQPAILQYITEICWQLKGWIGYCKWQQSNSEHPYIKQTIAPIEIITIWLATEVFWLKNNKNLLGAFQPIYQKKQQNQINVIFQKYWLTYISDFSRKNNLLSENSIKKLKQNNLLDTHKLKWLWQRAYELNYQEHLFKSIQMEQVRIAQANETTKLIDVAHSTTQTKKAQWVFCIDVRSEGFRRHLEKTGAHETFGFAGFFGIAYQLKDHSSHKVTYQCPALIKPSLLVNMLTAPESTCENLTSSLNESITSIKKSMLSPFALYEILGLWFSLALILKNYSSHLLNKLKQKCANPINNNKTANPTENKQLSLSFQNIDTDTQVTLAKDLLKGIGLTKDFAEFIVICGHSATTENNPYQAALDCGACGGNSGMSNAIIACQLLNQAPVRTNLATAGITIPNDTVFIAACHNTTTDKIHWHTSQDSLNDQQQIRLNDIKRDAETAGLGLQQERLCSLPGDQQVNRRSAHWAELIPEWGLVNNTAFIIGPRQVSQALNLQRRVFLHSYNSENDPNGEILESIFLGPVIVAHWINSQYYFSAVNPLHYGSGNKAIHNLLPNMGVMEGNQSDLKFGLPTQSVFYQNKRLHQPQRLLVLIDTELNRIKTIVSKHPVLKSLVDGKWIFIKSLREKHY